MRYPIPIITKKLLNSARKTTGKVRKVITGMNPCKLEFDVSAKSSSYNDAEHFHPILGQHVDVPAGQYVLLAVGDTGQGMPADVGAKAFEPFFTTKGLGKGTGLGLSQVLGFVKQSGGHVKIYSEPHHGTTIKIYLPRFMGVADELLPFVPVEAGPPGQRDEVVLVVEDEERMLQVSCDAFRELGYTVLQAGGPIAALRVIDAHPEITLLFTDVVMPEMNGRQLAREAVLRVPKLKILYTTGLSRNAVIHNGVLDQDVNFISKPFTIEQLASKARAVLDGANS